MNSHLSPTLWGHNDRIWNLVGQLGTRGANWGAMAGPWWKPFEPYEVSLNLIGLHWNSKHARQEFSALGFTWRAMGVRGAWLAKIAFLQDDKLQNVTYWLLPTC